MITSNHLIAHATAHVFSVVRSLTPCLLLLFALDSQAMSQSPDEAVDTPPYVPARWHEHASPEDDAARALANADTRLLAFATRGTSIPGVDPALKQAYSEHCGLRFIEGFGDVIRSDEQLQQMRLAGDYAERYNRIIITGCPLNQ